MPKISIIMPMYNGERYLGEAIENVIAQTLTDWELIIVDDGSSDGSRSLAQTFTARDRRIRFVTQANSGPTAARNRGAREASPSSEYLIFLDQDDIWEPQALETLGIALSGNPDAVAAHGTNLYIDSEGRLFALSAVDRYVRTRRSVVGMRGITLPSEKLTTFAVMVRQCAIQTPGQVLIRRSALDAMGLFDLTVGAASDWDMWLRLSSKGEVLFTEKAVLRYRHHGTNMTQDRRMVGAMTDRLYHKWLTSPDVTDKQRELVWLGHCWRDWDCAVFCWLWAIECLARCHLVAAAKQLRHMLIHLAYFYMGLYVRDTRLCVPGRQVVLACLDGGAWKETWGYQRLSTQA